MSTKIYKGFKVNTDSFSQIRQIVKDFTPWITAQAESVMDSFYLHASAAKKTEDANVDLLWLDLREKARIKNLRIPAVDTEFKLLFIPKDGFLLGIVYTTHDSWYEQWCKQPMVQEYSFWNNSDKPDNISESQWEQRGLDWDVLDYSPANLQGFSIDLVSDDGPLPPELRKI